MSDDPFGLDVRAEDLRRRPGTKWASVDGRLAAWIADMDFPVAPAITSRLVDLAGRDVGYPWWPGIGRSALPERFAARMGERFAWPVDPARLHELADVMQGVVLAIHHLTAPGDGVVLHVPAYPPFLQAIEGTGRRVVGVPARVVDGRWAFDHDELDARLATERASLLLLCHPHNPTGHVFDRPSSRGWPRSPPVTGSRSSATRSTPSSYTRRTATCRSPPSARTLHRERSPSRPPPRRSTSPACGGPSSTPGTTGSATRCARSRRTTWARPA